LFDKVLGRTKANTLRISQDDKGLRCEIDLPNTQVARDLVANMERGDVDQMSLLFTPVRQVWDETDPDHPLRTIEAAEVHEVSIVTFPAYEATEAALRSRENDYELHKKQKNYANASRRVRMKANQDMRKRGLRTA
jgi:HK97 family phage prohead protease